MPLAAITTNVLKSQIPKMFRKEALAMVAELCGCPASHSCVIVNAEADMAFCEGEGPAVIAMIRSDHSFSKEKNPVLFLKANEFFQKSLGANKERIYVEFFERDPDFCSVAGISMTEAMEQFKAMAQSGCVMSTTFESIFAEFPVFTLQENGKLLCTVTNHELPHRIETLREYVASKKFQRAMKIEQFMNANGQYFDDLGALYGCKLTMTLIAKDPEDLQRHIAGKKFKRALEKAKAKQAAAIANGDASDAPGAMEGMDDDHESGGDLLESGDEDSDEAISSDDDYEQEHGTRSARGARARHAEEEYPEFARNNDALGETAEDDSYDFAVMDTEMDTAVTANGAVKARKRKGENGNAGAQKKRLR